MQFSVQELVSHFNVSDECKRKLLYIMRGVVTRPGQVKSGYERPMGDDVSSLVITIDTEEYGGLLKVRMESPYRIDGIIKSKTNEHAIVVVNSNYSSRFIAEPGEIAGIYEIRSYKDDEDGKEKTEFLFFDEKTLNYVIESNKKQLVLVDGNSAKDQLGKDGIVPDLVKVYEGAYEDNLSIMPESLVNIKFFLQNNNEETTGTPGL